MTSEASHVTVQSGQVTLGDKVGNNDVCGSNTNSHIRGDESTLDDHYHGDESASSDCYHGDKSTPDDRNHGDDSVTEHGGHRRSCDLHWLVERLSRLARYEAGRHPQQSLKVCVYPSLCPDWTSLCGYVNFSFFSFFPFLSHPCLSHLSPPSLSLLSLPSPPSSPLSLPLSPSSSPPPPLPILQRTSVLQWTAVISLDLGSAHLPAYLPLLLATPYRYNMVHAILRLLRSVNP